MCFRVTIVGLGLIGGSLAKALRGWRDSEIIGVEKDSGVIRRALSDGAIDSGYASDEAASRGALASDVVIIALHPLAALDFIEREGGYAGEKSVWTDVAGVKAPIMQSAGKHLPRGTDFVGGHPMAGLEKFGYAHSRADLFRGCNYVAVPSAEVREESLLLIKEMIFYIGSARITFANAAEHDTMIAYVSQMPHVLAPAIIAGNNYFASKGFEGGSFHDLTRVGTLDPRLWSELFLLNSSPLAKILLELENNIARLRGLIETKDISAVAEALSVSTARKEERAGRPPAIGAENTI